MFHRAVRLYVLERRVRNVRVTCGDLRVRVCSVRGTRV